MRERGIAFTGPRATSIFAMLAIASALDMYAKLGVRVNTAYTPKRMLAAAEYHTKQKFRPRQYHEAAEALRKRAAEVRGSLPAGAIQQIGA